jgi:FtsP/CotA-like multicopper oxidase with cupredoxin domain
MHRFLSILLLLALLAGSAGPAAAQSGGQLYLPFAADAEDVPDASAQAGAPSGDQLYLPFASDERIENPFADGGVPGSNGDQGNDQRHGPVTAQEREEAAARALQAGALNPLMVDTGVTAAAMPGEAPRYFSHPNYANSPLPVIETVGTAITVGGALIDRSYATDFPVAVGTLAPVLVVLPDALPNGLLTSFKTWNQANPGASPFPSAGNVFHAYVLRPTGNANEYTVVFDSGLLTVPAVANPGSSEIATWTVANFAVQQGDRLAFYGQGIPVDTGTGNHALHYPSPTAPQQDSKITVGGPGYPPYPQARTYSFAVEMIDLSSPDIQIAGGMRKFVDTLPGLGAGAANNLGQYIPVAVPDTTTYPGTDYYIIELGEYEQQMHSDLPPTKLRGYRQAGGEFHYLGPAIVAQKDRPVRILFRNLLPTGAGGNLFIPVDTTVMGSGMTADGHAWMEANPDMVDPLNPMCNDPMMKAEMVAEGHCYAENRATLHLHGGVSPWISDGTPHQWITPAGENTPYPEGVSVVDVPDMATPGPGEMTFFYTNQQSARLMFYHDHAWGITRLNVYGGEAAPYIITDATEQALVAQGLLPGADATIPLVVQDKTFVPSMEQLADQDETWDMMRWGDMGDLWVPHVYSPAQNPGDSSGVNQYGRWAYGPWFWPPTNNVEYGPVDNPYFDANCDPDVTWCEPEYMPGVPYLSMGMESFNDTPVVNGTAYPTVEVDPKAYRFRILNAANDRFFNLSLYKAIDANGVICDASNPTPAPESTGVACTEVKLNPAEVAAALEDGTVFPTPVVGTEGPSWIQFGTEGGFLPAPVVVPAQPTTWVNDPTVFNAGNVDKHSLLIAPAERADVVVDFSQYAGQTLILYNDAPAAFPARDPRYDYYTGNGDYRETGGAPSTLPGYGPNTRTVMQIKVKAIDPAPAYNVNALKDAFKATSLGGQGVFQNGQNPIIVGQGAYNSAYGTSFQNNGPNAGLVQIHDTSLTFKTIDGASLAINLKPKMIQDEMGEAFEHEYGRMSGFLGVETPNAQAGLQNMILSPYVFPPTEILDGIELPAGVAVTPIAAASDGTQIWKITHNGVDTHPIHWHLYDVQLINRVGWDGIIRKPDLNELGWKDTVRISPLEDTIVALRPIVPNLPTEWGGLPNSIRLLDPSMPEGAYLANTTQQEAMGLPIFAFNQDGEPVDIINHYVNLGWEYVFHCHILSHEEMDMMHAQAVGVAPAAPTFVSAVRQGTGGNRGYLVTWIDNSKNETAFVIERKLATSPNGWAFRAMVQSSELGVVPFVQTGAGPGTGQRTYFDRTGNNTQYNYRVYAINVVGDGWDYSDPAMNEIPPGGGFPRLVLDSQGGATTVLVAPSGLTGTAVVKNKKTATVTLNWTDNSNGTASETGFLIQRAENAAFSLNVVNATVGPNVTTLKQDVARGKTFYYRVLAFNDVLQSGWSNTLQRTTP